jgi:hypothetical protein
MVTWTEQEALEKWLKTSANEVKAMSARNMRTVCPSAPLCPTSHHRFCVLKPLPERYSSLLCRRIRCIRHSSNACIVCSAHVELQAALCAPGPETTVARCQRERHRVQHHQAWQVAFASRPTGCAARIVCFCGCPDSCASLNACGIWWYRGYDEQLNIKSLQISWKKSESRWNDDSDLWLVLEVLPSLHPHAVLC